MNNSQFRKLVLDTPVTQRDTSISSNSTSQTRNIALASALGSRARSSIPMTPRSVSSSNSNYAKDFAYQLAQRKNTFSQRDRKFRSSAAPKGALLPIGYIDRAKSRLESSGFQLDNTKEERVRELENMRNRNEIDEEVFTILREQVLGESLNMERAGLVKGLDRRLLEKVKRGEVDAIDVLEGRLSGDTDGGNKSIDDELETMEKMKVEAVLHKKTKKKGEMAPPSLLGRKRNRDEILAELKATRKLACEPVLPRLGPKFKRVGDPRMEGKVVKDSQGREILITVDKYGKEKRKIRRSLVTDENIDKKHNLQIPDKNSKPLGMIVPELPKANDPEKEITIFDDVGDDYNPLSEINSNDNSDDDEASNINSRNLDSRLSTNVVSTTQSTASSGTIPPQVGPRNYFQNSLSGVSLAEKSYNHQLISSANPNILSVLNKASKINLKAIIADSEDLDSTGNLSELHLKQERHKRMLQRYDRDAEDLDLGFGCSRFEDDLDESDKTLKLSKWGSTRATESDPDMGTNIKGTIKSRSKK